MTKGFVQEMYERMAKKAKMTGCLATTTVYSKSDSQLAKENIETVIKNFKSNSGVELKFISDSNMKDRFQLRNHKKWRTNKKWGNRYGYYYIPKKYLLVYENYVVGHPTIIGAIRCANREYVEV